MLSNSLTKILKAHYSKRVGRTKRCRPFLERLEDRDAPSATPWSSYGGNPQHTATSTVAAQSLDTIHWHTPVDLNPVFNGNDLLIHYGSPLVTAANTVIVPVKTGSSGGFEVEGLDGTTGAVKWTQTTDYILPPHNWTPSFSPVLTPNNRLYFAGAGGTIYYIDSPDSSGATITGHIAFYGISNYNSNPSAYNSTVFINTPITSDASGNIYFGFQTTGTPPSGLKSGIARIGADGTGIWVAATTAANDSNIIKVVMNNSPAISNDGTKVYIAVSAGGSGKGYLLELNSSTLATVNRALLKDVKSGNPAQLPDDGTSSTTVGPDGDVYFGVLENPFPSNNDRGWLLHFSGDLSTSKTPGAFGWDDTTSIVPASMVPSYSGNSSYLLMTKYNNYAGIGTGNGQNKIAVLDPNATETDPVTGATVMNEVLTILGPTPDSEHPGGVREWCINNAAVDPFNKAIYANSEDGKLYRWDMATNTFTQVVTLTSGVGEAYTPTVIGVDGTVYAVNNATLFAIGTSIPASPSGLSGSPATGNSVNLSWTNNATNQTGFHLDRATDQAFTQNLVTQTLPATPFTFTDTAAGLAPGNTYYYRIRAFNAGGDSSNSTMATVAIPAIPAAPTNAQVINATTTELDLTWTDNAGSNAANYVILRAVNHGAFVSYATLPAQTSFPPTTYSWNDTGLASGTFYDYEIEAVNTSGSSSIAEANATTLTVAPTNFQATPGDGSVALSWTAPAGAVSYNVYRSIISGGEAANPIKTGLTTANFTDTAVTNGVTYYYVVTAVNANAGRTPAIPSESAQSSEVSATPQPASSLVLAIAAGGKAASPFVADTDFSGGSVSGGTTATIDTGGVSNPPPQSVLQHGRYGNMTYTIPNLTAGASYTVRLDFVEYVFNAAGNRLFNVAINGTQVLSNFDIWKTAGGKNKALAESFTATAASNGTITISFTSLVNNAIVGGVEIYANSNQKPPAPTGLTAAAGNNQVALNWGAVTGATGYNVYRGTSSGTETLLAAGTNVGTDSFTDTTAVNGTQYFYYVTALKGALESGKSNEVSATPAASSLILAIAAGGKVASPFVADTDFSGGNLSTGTTATIDTTGVTNPPPQSVLQHGRYGNMTYTIPNLTAGATYTVRLDFVEFYFNAAGNRLFNVAINGAQVLSNFDIWKSAGGKNKALAESFTATASSNGAITISFTSLVNNAIVSGIEIYS